MWVICYSCISSISKILGNTKVGTFAASLFQSLNLQISQASLNKIPQLTPSTSNSNAFQVLIYGDISKPTAVNSFKWVTTQDVTKASQNLGVSVPKSIQGVATQIQQAASSIKSNMQQNTYIPSGLLYPKLSAVNIILSAGNFISHF